MSVLGLKYPTAAARANVGRFPSIAARLTLAADRSPLEMVRLLDNPRYDHIDELLDFVDRQLVVAGEIGDRVLQAQSQEAMAQALAEMELFGHLRATLGSSAHAAVERPGMRTNDIDVELGGLSVRIEVYTPLELAGWQLFERNLATALTYLDVDRGYDIRFEVSAATDSSENQVRHFYYAYDFPAEAKVRDWFSGFLDAARQWLRSKEPEPTYRCLGPANVVQVVLTLEEVRADRSDRMICGGWGGRSNSTRLSFEPPAGVIAAGEWGKKLRRKLDRRQCGAAAPDVVRILVLNFNLGDESRFEFMNTEKFAARFSEFVGCLVNPDDLPYEAVLPAVLRLTCGFGRPAVIDQDRSDEIERLLTAAALDRQVEDPPPGDPAELFDELKDL